MRLPLIMMLCVLLSSTATDFYIYRCCRRFRHNRTRQVTRRVAMWSSVLLTVWFIGIVCWPKRNGNNDGLTVLMWNLFTYFSIYVSKYVWTIIDLLSNLPRLIQRRRVSRLGRCGCAVAILTFASLWWGALVTRNNIQVKKVDIELDDLPAAFDGFTIAQFSDLHTGSFGSDTSFTAKLVRQINELEADAIVFTGDIVNRRSEELEPFTDVLSHLHAPAGVYSILGNHDYGDYYNWPDSTAKKQNMELLHALQRRMGWHLLLNESAVLSAGSDSLVLIGVENVGDPPFHSYGDLDIAYPGDLDDPTCKILLSHNPAHWTTDIANAPDKNIALTLSGHTHAMQIEIFGLSPAVFRYPTWGGMYDDGPGGHRLYVNIGCGEVGIPARIGATPEVTLFTLHRKQWTPTERR